MLVAWGDCILSERSFRTSRRPTKYLGSVIVEPAKKGQSDIETAPHQTLFPHYAEVSPIDQNINIDYKAHKRRMGGARNNLIDIHDQSPSSKTHLSPYRDHAKILRRCVTTEQNLRVRRMIYCRLHGILRFNRWSDVHFLGRD